MTLLERLKIRIPEEPNEAVLEDVLESAKSIYLNLRFPYGQYPDEIEVRYADWVLRAAVELYNKQGAEGEISHSENGISRSYESSWLSTQLIKEIVPMCGIVGQIN